MAETAGKGERGMTAEQALKAIKDQNLRWIELFYTDLFGGFNHIHMPSHTLDLEAFDSGIPKL
ncbi:MAG: hypothetical protein L3K08_09145, partial [Thermoplasmata archaeon]|nr:hypothetical protein [Thermoplasmata archaeon]